MRWHCVARSCPALNSYPCPITHSEVSSWVHSLTDEGLAPATVRHAHRVLPLALTAAVRDGRLIRNVAEGVPLPRVVATPKRFLTHDQVQALAEAFAPYDTLIRVLAYAGLRWPSSWP